MPRPIASYTASEWLRLRPASQAYKSFLLDRTDRRFCAAPAPRPDDVAAASGLLGSRAVIATIAFNSAWTIGWQLRFIGRNLRNAAFLVADNSSDPKARQEIRALCQAASVAYLGLPPNPYSERRHASRSHGLALNWVYRRIIRPLGFRTFGFFDHDLFPTRPFDPTLRLRGQPFYGDLEVRPGGRYLWPGYSLFDGGFDRAGRLDFRQDWFLGLDTGGMSSRLLEETADGASLVFARRRSIGPARNMATGNDEIDWFDDCLHLGNASGWYRETAAREAALGGFLEEALAGRVQPPHAVP